MQPGCPGPSGVGGLTSESIERAFGPSVNSEMKMKRNWFAGVAAAGILLAGLVFLPDMGFAENAGGGGQWRRWPRWRRPRGGGRRDVARRREAVSTQPDVEAAAAVEPVSAQPDVEAAAKHPLRGRAASSSSLG